MLTHERLQLYLVTFWLLPDLCHYPVQCFPRDSISRTKKQAGGRKLVTSVRSFRQALLRNIPPFSSSTPELSDWCLPKALALHIYLKHVYKVALLSLLLTLPAPHSLHNPLQPHPALKRNICLPFLIFPLLYPHQIFQTTHLTLITLRKTLKSAIWCTNTEHTKAYSRGLDHSNILLL